MLAKAVMVVIECVGEWSGHRVSNRDGTATSPETLAAAPLVLVKLTWIVAAPSVLQELRWLVTN